ncbi:MAG: glycosyltransferase [Candidatus Nanoarchaeia archaeon]|nr:glycosyltransferase [Candidatus Nanoarchaeia archaeon]
MISIIITAYKEEKTIGKAIEAIRQSKIREKYEILVFAPDDETLNTAKKYKVKAVKDEGKGKPAALNLAFRKAKGEILILTDGDVYLGKDAVNYMLEKFSDKNVGVVSGRPVSTDSRQTMLGYWSHLLTDTAHRIRTERVREGQMIVCSGYLYAFRKSLIKKIPEQALSEDAVISHMIADQGYKSQYAEKALVFVKYPTNLHDWIIQKKRSAGGYNQLSQMVKGKERMRSFSKESAGIFKVLSYPRNLKEFLYTAALVFTRLYLWALIFIDINLKKKEFKKIWLRVESTK